MHRPKEQPKLQTSVILWVEGGFIAGKVIDTQTGKPVKSGESSDTAFYGSSRPRSGAVESPHIQDDGPFRIRVARGENYLYIRFL